jgi:DNA processing protein
MEGSLAGDMPETPEHLELRLALIPGVGPKTWRALCERFGSAARVFAASRHELQTVPGVGDILARRIQEAARAAPEKAVLQTCRQYGLSWMLVEDACYPRLLAEIAQPPVVLFYRGQFQTQDDRAIAIVGTRHASAYGMRQADRLARQLVEAGFTIISGLARGIDAAAHRAALAAGGRTIAVLGGGLPEVYPREHQELAEQITRQGVLLSEMAPERPPQSGNFPQRNRIISGLSLGVVVVEAGLRSGALITARHAMEQGREVFAVPGPIDSPTSRGCHQLLRDGAKLVESYQDILEEIASLLELVREKSSPFCRTAAQTAQQPPAIMDPPPVALSETERRLWQAISCDGSLIDDAIAASGLPTPQALVALTQLELKRFVRRTSGASVIRLRPQ